MSELSLPLTIPTPITPGPGGPPPVLSETDLETLSGEVEQVLEHGFPRLRFPERIETIFLAETRNARTRHFMIVDVIALLTYDLFLFIDRSMLTDLFQTALLIRLGIVTPLGLLLLMRMRHDLKDWVLETLHAGIVILSGLFLLLLVVYSEDPNAIYYSISMILVLMFSNIVARLRFWYALFTTVLMVGVYAAYNPSSPQVPEMVGNNYLILLISVAFFSLYANYSMERDYRRSYLLTLRETLRRSVLVVKNTRLAELTSLDPLTGLLNRRGLDEFLEQIQLQPRYSQLAVVMFDIDNFKTYNDTYGHPAGDECLKRIGEVFASSLRQSGDVVARYGGEEFAVILPGADLESAYVVAERMRRTVLKLAIPHKNSPVLGRVTISGGVAAGPVESVLGLFSEADKALYQAKGEGRNRVNC